MNRYSLQAEGRRWWWTSASAGLVATAAITAILTTPVSGAASPDKRDYDRVSQLPPPPAPDATRPCFIVQDQWNEALDGPQPTCPLYSSSVGR